MNNAGTASPLLTQNPPDPLPPLPWTVRLLGLASLLNDMASEMIAPVLPLFLSSLPGGGKTWLGLIEGVADSLSSLLKLWSGATSDRIGRQRAFIAGGYLLAALSRPVLAIVSLPWHVFGLRTVDRIGKGLRSAPRDALIARSTSPEDRGRAFGFHRSMDHLGAAIGPLLAAAFLAWRPADYRTLFALALIPGLCVVVLMLFGLRNPNSRPEASAARKGAGQWSLRPFDANFRLYLAALFLDTLGTSSDMFLLLRLNELGVPVVALPVVWCTFHVVKSFTNWRVGRAVKRFGAKRLLVAGWLGYAIVYAGLGLAREPWQAIALLHAYAVVYSLAEPPEKTLVTQLCPIERLGLAFGWFNLTLGLAALPASLLFGIVYDAWGGPAAFLMGAGISLIATILLGFVRATRMSS